MDKNYNGNPAASQVSSTIASEDEALHLIDSFFPRAHKDLQLGRGDDCAELAVRSPLAVSTDLFLEDVHFRRSYFSPEDIGHKALAVNLSDLASAGARPAGFSLGLMCPPGLDRNWLTGLFKGMSALAARYDLPLTGGDISAAPMLGFSITVWGASWFEPGLCLDFFGYYDPLEGDCGCGNCSPKSARLGRTAGYAGAAGTAGFAEATDGAEAAAAVSIAQKELSARMTMATGGSGHDMTTLHPGSHDFSAPFDSAKGRHHSFIRRGAEVGDILFALSPGKTEGDAYIANLFDGFAPGRDDSAQEGPCILGLAAAGLELLERGGSCAVNDFPAACAALLRPQPMLAAGRALALAARARGARVRAMDLSDGLLRDLPRLLNGQSRNQGAFPAAVEGLGAELDFDPLSLHPELLRYAALAAGDVPAGPDGTVSGNAQRLALSLALRGGDEYALLCACPVHDFETVAESLNIFAPGTGIKTLGRVSGTPGLRWRGQDVKNLLPEGGFDHFGK